MTMTQWFLFFLILQVVHFLGTWKLYIKADRKAWEAIIPIYNAYVLMKIINRSTWWVVLLFIPIINLLMFPILWIETIRSFGKNSTLDTTLALFTFGFYTYYVNYACDVKHIKDRSLKPASNFGDWASSIAFAIIAATLVHTYFMRPYTIPTSSLEKSLLVGDFLFVSKFHYGARIPMTAVAMPMVHDSIPMTGLPSYLDKPQLPYMRLPGIQKIKRNDIVVFNWPADSLKTMWGDDSGEFTYKPIDKKTNYVKRCVAIAGDTLQIIDGVIYINGEISKMPDRAKPQYYFTVDTGGKQLSARNLQRYNVREGHMQDGKYVLNLTDTEARKLKNNPSVKSIVKRNTPSGNFDKGIFPHDEQYKWSVDNYGPLYIPAKGKTIEINSKTIPIYEHLIREYDRNDITVDGDKMYINGQLAESYTFKQDYFWMMGDNRHNSLDARSYGFTPFDHVIGKAVFIWFSWETNGDGIKNKIRWDRLFTVVHGSGKATSYFYPFLGLLAIYFGFNYFRKKKKEA